MCPDSKLVTAERDGYIAICPSLRPNPDENEVDVGCVKRSGTQPINPLLTEDAASIWLELLLDQISNNT